MTPLTGDTRRTVRGPEWRRKQTLFSFTATPTAGTEVRSILPIRRAEKSSIPTRASPSTSFGATHRCLGW